MNISNRITLLRIVLAFACIGFIAKYNLVSLVIAFILFLIASFTDFLDGYFARKYQLVSDLGKILDPIADKILILGVFLAFLDLKILNLWMFIAIMLREFIITGLRLYSLKRNIVLEAKWLGKHKTLSQIVGIIVIFITIILMKLFPQNSWVLFSFNRVIPAMMWYIVLITLFSGVHYFWVNRKIIKTL